MEFGLPNLASINLEYLHASSNQPSRTFIWPPHATTPKLVNIVLL